jgi:hypothetical protein
MFRRRQLLASTAFAISERHLSLPKSFKGAILATNLPGIWRAPDKIYKRKDDLMTSATDFTALRQCELSPILPRRTLLAVIVVGVLSLFFYSDTANAQLATEIVSMAGPPKCLDVSNSNSENGTPIIIFDCHGGINQQWIHNPSDGTIRGLAGRCLDVTGASAQNGTPVILFDCNGGPNQKWNIVITPNGAEFRGLGDKCLDASGGSASNGTPVIIFDCHGRQNQIWHTPASR